MDTQRLILLLVFFFSCMMLWDAWQRKDLPPPPPAAQQVPAAGVPGSAAVPSAPTAAPASPSAVPTTGKPVSQAPVLKVRTDLVAAEISAQGGDLVRLELLKHQAHDKPDMHFVLFDPTHAYAAQSGLIGAGLPNHKSLWTLPTTSLELKDGDNELRVSLEAAVEGGGKVVKTYVFKRGSYLVDVEHAFVGGAAPAGTYAYFQLTRDDKSPEGSDNAMSTATFTGAAIYTDQEKFKKVDFGDFGGAECFETARSCMNAVITVESSAFHESERCGCF